MRKYPARDNPAQKANPDRELVEEVEAMTHNESISFPETTDISTGPVYFVGQGIHAEMAGERSPASRGGLDIRNSSSQGRIMPTNMNDIFVYSHIV